MPQRMDNSLFTRRLIDLRSIWPNTPPVKSKNLRKRRLWEKRAKSFLNKAFKITKETCLKEKKEWNARKLRVNRATSKVTTRMNKIRSIRGTMVSTWTHSTLHNNSAQMKPSLPTSSVPAIQAKLIACHSHSLVLIRSNRMRRRGRSTQLMPKTHS